MLTTETGTQTRILAAAKTEFLEKGFRNASLRTIVKLAGVTTGAFYGYYSNKEALFSALVEPYAAAIMGKFMQAQDDFIHQMVEVEVDATFQFLKTLHRLGKAVPPIDRQLCHIVSSGMFSGVFEIVVHDMTKENAKSYISALRRFYQAGWAELMQIKI